MQLPVDRVDGACGRPMQEFTRCLAPEDLHLFTPDHRLPLRWTRRQPQVDAQVGPVQNWEARASRNTSMVSKARVATSTGLRSHDDNATCSAQACSCV